MARKRRAAEDSGAGDQEPQGTRAGLRRRDRAESADADVPVEGPGGQGQGEPAARAGDEPVPGQRMEAMRQIARRRAAHFATFQADDEAGSADDGDNIHTGGDQARNLGPWSSARELSERREEAAEARKLKMMKAGAAGGEVANDVEWTPSMPAENSGRSARSRRRLKPLFDTCLSLLAEYADCIETLQGIPDTIKVKLADAACSIRMLSPEVAQVFASGAPKELVLKDLTQCDEPALYKLLEEAATPRLERLELGMAGRGFGSKVAEMLGRAQLGSLAALTVAGAYRLDDKGLQAMLKAAPKLLALGLQDGCRLQDSISVLPSCCPNLKDVNLSGCRGLSPDSLNGGLLSLKQLSSLNLDGVTEINDSFLEELGASTPIERLSINLCSNVTDKGICVLAEKRGIELLSLSCNDVGKLTDRSLEELAQRCPALKEAHFQRCHKLTDEGIALVAANGRLETLAVAGIPTVSAKTFQALASRCHETLEEINIAWCRAVTDNMLGLLADSCAELHTITAWGCTSITQKFLDGHRNENLVRVLGPGV